MRGQLLILHLNDRNDVVGYVYGDASNPLFLRVEKAHCVRVWGTQRGLGQLGAEGPLGGTRLDARPPGTLVGVLQIVEVIVCDEAAWLAKGFPAREGQS